ncbi:MAG: hypothetical protein NC041_04545 [Bacteroides sp.]|nr:hypothetical protein [Prevotella sp.]MCM1407228.1 hypothetical protein [Treponema brennaborense]MCM1469716.1 hypothetical protein [Bacteroides sp.]
MKKFLLSCVILLAAAAAALYIGWTELHVPIGSYAVMITKTGGIYPLPIENGGFTWRWERLLPTNTELRCFSVTPAADTVKTSGTLPSGEIYSAMLEGKPDFSYQFDVAVSLRIRAASLPAFIRKTNIQTQAELDQYLAGQIENAARTAAGYIAANRFSDNEELRTHAADTESIIGALEKERAFSEIEITSLGIAETALPDANLYLTAKDAYAAYQSQVRESVLASVREQAGYAADDYLQIERFARWGKILQDYPVLIEFLAVTRDDASQLASVLEKLRQKK